MLTEVLKYLRNYFPDVEKAENGKFTIESGTISLPFIVTNQYYLIEGSVFNDGVHKYPSTDLTDEAFTGRITPLKVPNEVVSLANDIEAYMAKYGEASPYQSESFGGYSYSKGQGSSWTEVFKTRLAMWKKI